MPLVRRSGGGSSGPTIVEAATAPPGVAGLVWRNEGVHKVFLDAAWRDLTYYNGDKAQVRIDIDLLPANYIQYLSADYLTLASPRAVITGYAGTLTHALQQGGYVEIELTAPTARKMYVYFGPYSRAALPTSSPSGGVLYEGVYGDLHYGTTFSGYGTESGSTTTLILGVSRDASDNVRFYRGGTDMGIIPPSIVAALAGWHPSIWALTNDDYIPFSHAWHVDESTIQYLPDGFQPINEQ